MERATFPVDSNIKSYNSYFFFFNVIQIKLDKRILLPYPVKAESLRNCIIRETLSEHYNQISKDTFLRISVAAHESRDIAGHCSTVKNEPFCMAFRCKRYREVVMDRHLLWLVLSLMLLTEIGSGCGESGVDPNPFGYVDRPALRFYELAWGPTGKIIFGHSLPGDTDADSAGYWLMNADGTEIKPFLFYERDGLFYDPDWSPDGQWLALNKDGQIFKMRATGEDLTQLTFGAPKKYDPAWSPDGQWIVFYIQDGPRDQWGIWKVSATGTGLTRLAYQDSVNAGMHPDWSVQGKIVFTGGPDAIHNEPALMIMKDTGGLASILFNPAKFGYTSSGGSNAMPSRSQFSPDGTKVVFMTGVTERHLVQVWVVNANGSGTRRLTSDGGVYPTWSPDSQRIAYVKYAWLPENSVPPGYGQIWVMDADGRNKRQLTH